MVGSRFAWRKKLRFIYIWGRRWSHRTLGKSGAIPARMDKKCALNVLMARSSALRLWMSGSTSGYLIPNYLVKFLSNEALQHYNIPWTAIAEYFCQCLECLHVTARMDCLLVLICFYWLDGVFCYPHGCNHWCLNGDMTVLWVKLVLAGDTDPASGRYLEF